MLDSMAQSPPPSDAAPSARNILGRPTQYSWMQQSSVLSQPPLKASGKHVQRQLAIVTDTLAYEYPVQVQHSATADASARPNCLPSPAPSDHHDKSPSLHAVHQPPPMPNVHQSPTIPRIATAHQSPSIPTVRISKKRHASATSSLANTPTVLRRSVSSSQPPPPPNAALPFGPQWSAVFQADECTRRLSAFASAHAHLNDADLERLGTLYDATIQNDWYFIILLMLLACHFLNSPSLASLRLPQHSLPMFARLLGEQCEGSRLSPEVQLFISTFPKPLDELSFCLTEQSFTTAIRHITACLHQITLNLDRVLSQCRQAETLPTVHDLIEGLGIRSLLFQRATFRFLLRNTWGSDSGPLAELAMREFMDEQQRFGVEGGQSPDVRSRQQSVYRNIFRQHKCSTTAPPIQQSTVASGISAPYNATPLQPHPSPRHFQPPRQAQMPAPAPNGAQLQATQMNTQMRIQMQMQAQMQMRARAQAQAQPVQPPQPALFQSQPQAASLPLPTSAYFQNNGVPSPAHTAMPYQGITTSRDLTQMQALMMYSRQIQPPQHPQHPQHPGLPSSPSLATQRSRPQRFTQPPRLFFPGPNASVAQPAHPDYRKSALHQAHMRSPILVPKDASVRGTSNDHYRCVTGFGLQPHRLTTDPIQEIPFHLTPDVFAHLLKVKVSIDGDPPSGESYTNSIMLRLRCCEVSPLEPLPAENKWAQLDGSWPIQAYFAVNQNPLEPRRKLHHGKCLPIDITHHVSIGTNKLVVRINRLKHDKSAFNYAVAVEIVGFMTRDSIKEACMNRLVPSEQILASINKSLASDDDDCIMQSNFTLHLFEPFSNAKIFDTPVRSKDCLHKQAFDLDVFLETRLEPSTKLSNDRISKVDSWKCPICRADSRPQSLIVDGFLVGVRESLAAKALLNTRSIIIESDGSWSPVQESHDEEETEDEAAPAPKKNIEIILIDDD
ncbi:hypothetical protein E4T38_02737 [Aureobasidium subglaciale]|nr:hypothetical protein E4T38_02737 [Aureobasidium subglaciale]KAI5227560.1 hypothetical protein E4T40_02438 [Aureobasidium subglaciale]KAI5230924.1 hypothetical protein E4T41_02736 [Aureobasidium subglaciale]KAI5265221.1 hypothetical protein E4T46_02514 [Aureobasidium subglaciale]